MEYLNKNCHKVCCSLQACLSAYHRCVQVDTAHNNISVVYYGRNASICLVISGNQLQLKWPWLLTDCCSRQCGRHWLYIKVDDMRAPREVMWYRSLTPPAQWHHVGRKKIKHATCIRFSPNRFVVSVTLMSAAVSLIILDLIKLGVYVGRSDQHKMLASFLHCRSGDASSICTCISWHNSTQPRSIHTFMCIDSCQLQSCLFPMTCHNLMKIKWWHCEIWNHHLHVLASHITWS